MISNADMSSDITLISRSRRRHHTNPCLNATGRYVIIWKMHSISHNRPNTIDGINSNHLSLPSTIAYACVVLRNGAFTASNTTICAIVHNKKPTHRNILWVLQQTTLQLTQTSGMVIGIRELTMQWPVSWFVELQPVKRQMQTSNRSAKPNR